MKRVIKHAYDGKSWKNVVSIGDGEAEYNAIRVPWKVNWVVANQRFFLFSPLLGEKIPN